MYLAQINIWNFRKYGCDNISENPGLSVNFNKGLNLLVGENDSGKTTIVDSIKYVLGTQSYDLNRIEEIDFYYDEKNKTRKKELKIECIFKEFTIDEASKFIEWINLDSENNIELRIRITSKLKDGKVHTRLSAGIDGVDISFEARDLLRTIYLKPLRDAEKELSSGYRSRFAQILKHYTLFKKEDNEEHPLEKIANNANEQIEGYFSKENESGINNEGRVITESIDEVLKKFMGVDFYNNNYNSKVSITGNELSKILSRLMLKVDENKVGLGSLNQLYMSMELLLLEETINTFKLVLIEEIEAHIHPQAQLRVIKYLQSKENTQFIITTHSITLASVVKVENLILCNNNNVFPMNREYTKLDAGDYEFLNRFLDATKSNLLFAKGVILVEGDAENILIPTIADIIEKPLEKFGVSVVNVGSTAFLRYSNIFKRIDGSTIGIPVSIVTDLDVRPKEYYYDEIKGQQVKKYKFKNVDEWYKDSLEEINIDEIKSYKSNEEREILEKLEKILGISLEECKEQQDSYIEEIIDENICKDKCEKIKPYKLYKFSDSKVKQLEDMNKSSGVEIDIKSYNSKSNKDIESILRQILNKSRLTMNVKKEYINEINNYSEFKKFIKLTKENKYELKEIKLFTNTWTMEYDIALSELRDYILAAIMIAKNVKNDENIIDNIVIEEYIEKAYSKILLFKENNKSDEEIAYEIYKPLLDKNASKAVTAQYLSKILQDRKNEVKPIIESDKNIKYIVDAIKHVIDWNSTNKKRDFDE